VDKIHAKWGFGNAPLKANHIAKAEAAIHVVTAILASLPESPTVEQLEALSHVKGQFTRTVKQDQWDWFTVWARLGSPSRQPANMISKTLGDLRSALKAGDQITADQAASKLQETDIMRYFDSFLAGGRERPRQPGAHGFIYILSTRSQPRLLKIGVTQRTVEVRVKEINSATGVIVPYGVRAVWRVDDAAEVEQELHTLLAPYRIRADREFFELDFFEASRLINDHLGTRRMLKDREREQCQLAYVTKSKPNAA
jgi:T5orf172 domain